jgi:CDGSH-type Zn-finger protein/uncharacterized Fe-S cluster protein YjdI
MSTQTRTYTNGEITVLWKPEQCIHSTLCWKNLADVFNPRVRPWVNMKGANTDLIKDQVMKCPSGALSIAEELPSTEMENTNTQIEVTPNGPVVIKSSCMIKHADGREELREGKTFLCRCGASNNKPYCDGAHKKINFQG